MSFKPGHDGTIAALDASAAELVFSYESEKDSFPRYSTISPTTVLDAAARLDVVPDVIAISGWLKFPSVTPVGAGYYGLAQASEIVEEKTIFGKKVHFYSSTHERSHLWGAYGMSPFPAGTPCYVLIWEGWCGDFYEIDEYLQVLHLGRVMANPGDKYAFLYALADPEFILPKGPTRMGDAGKLMALCAYGQTRSPDQDEQALLDFLLPSNLYPIAKKDLRNSPYYNIGVTNQKFTNLAKRVSDGIFGAFYNFAKKNMTKGHPLLISGGCGLNCEWNRGWLESNLFPDVFIPPCANDTGSAIGTAVDAMRHFTGSAKIKWNVYSGQPFIHDEFDGSELEVHPLDYDRVASALLSGKVIGWVQGNCEIGPRALGNRSIVAEPFSKATHERLNRIKNREGFRPIAPVCLEDDVALHFDLARPSPHMLFFQRVLDSRLEAVTHVDGTARAQTVSAKQNLRLFQLLTSFKAKSGAGVLCNTSLNFNGTGFINRASDLLAYARATGLDGFVINDSFYLLPEVAPTCSVGKEAGLAADKGILLPPG
ncbi:proline dehydrogenase [Mesorhizobium sp. C089B]|uniref:carbamoyltransferase C-terminal domain-containing protein n=1 Tax=unclassified Mesorhizobium TaxID=325217 RepID=UPI0003D021C5|nr:MULTISPECIES: carbamoyltransferase C-terminal domain-containing protein [unclassified Mesorhizobium]ESZ00002.1 proline dehydrogenase [Mesorhizobium sp. L2C089B000]WJI54409.1 proline dehydrogenase [Mesorhizobium sp. C089B]